MTFHSYPYVIQPAYMNYLWGGIRIPQYYNRQGVVEPCAESWEASDRCEGPNYILNGPLKGCTLSEGIQSNQGFKKRLPFLIKLIDAKRALSIQVHPCETSAPLLKGEPKTEAWHILDAKPDSFIYLGLKENVSLKEVQEAIYSECLEQYLNKIKVYPNQTYLIPAGVIHSIGEGCLIYEVQQNSNTTYRLYDWNRLDAKGKKRPLHLKEGLRALKPQQGPYTHEEEKIISTSNNCRKLLVSCPYFSLFQFTLSSHAVFKTDSLLRHWFIRRGSCYLKYASESILLTKGQSLLIPPYSIEFILEVGDEPCTILEATCDF